jgi:probable F420-dependent oxidoreductase
MLELAAERADGAHPYFVPVEHTRLARERLGADPVLVVEVTAVIDGDRGRARETARAFATRYLGMANYANNLRRLGYTDDDLAGAGSDRLLGAVVVQGDAAAVAARVREHLDAGADHVVVQLRAPSPANVCLEGFSALGAELADQLG